MFRPAIYDLIITDMVMPGMNGWELVGAIHSIAPKLPIVIITGYSSNNSGVWNKQFLNTQGIIAVVNKPLDFDYLLSIVEDYSYKKIKST
jgi:DNA-binding NtrC family response regulator